MNWNSTRRLVSAAINNITYIRPHQIVINGRCMISTSCQLLATEGEMKITQILKDKLNPSYVDVKDISGGCGAMYQITIDADIFKDKRMIQQHKMVNEALGDEIKSLHGLTIQIGNPNSK